MLEMQLTSPYPMTTVRQHLLLHIPLVLLACLCVSSVVRIGFSSDVYEVTESTGSVNVQVVNNGSNDIAISVLLNTIAGTALGKYTDNIGRGMNSTIRRTMYVYVLFLSVSDDYTALSSEVSFSPSQSEQFTTITISVINDNIHEKMEQFTVQLSLPSGSTGVVLDQDSATVHIVDDDRQCPEWRVRFWSPT